MIPNDEKSRLSRRDVIAEPSHERKARPYQPQQPPIIRPEIADKVLNQSKIVGQFVEKGAHGTAPTRVGCGKRGRMENRWSSRDSGVRACRNTSGRHSGHVAVTGTITRAHCPLW